MPLCACFRSEEVYPLELTDFRLVDFEEKAVEEVFVE